MPPRRARLTASRLNCSECVLPWRIGPSRYVSNNQRYVRFIGEIPPQADHRFAMVTPRVHDVDNRLGLATRILVSHWSQVQHGSPTR